MTDLLSRPVLRVQAPDDEPRRSIVLASVLAVLWVVAVGLAVCEVLAVAAWFAADTGSFAGAARVGGFAWLVAGGAGLRLDDAVIGVVPLGAVLASALLLHRGGRWVAGHCQVRSAREAAVAIGVMTVMYAAAFEAGALLVSDDTASVGLLRAPVAAAAVALVAGGLGVLRGSGLGAALLARAPEEVRAALAGGLAGMLTMVAAGGVLLTASLVVHFSDALVLAEALSAGVVGGLVVAVVGMALVPNAVLCAGAFMAGPGFRVGEGTLVAPDSVDLGALPAFPLLAALPQGDDLRWTQLLVLAPVLAGAVAGELAARRWPVYSLDRAALRGGVAGLTGGLGFGGLCWLATGAAGPGRLGVVGPDVLPVLVVAVVAGLVGGAIGAVAAHWLGSWRRRRDAD